MKKIGIVGGGYSGTALLAMLCKHAKEALEIIICDQTGCFGEGPAYQTPYTHHLLNVRAGDMSAFEDDATHFVRWLETQPDKLALLDNKTPLAIQFVPRCFYREYLQSLIQSPTQTVRFESIAIVDLMIDAHAVHMIAESGQSFSVDEVVLALGNNPPSAFPFPIASGVKRIDNPWDYVAIEHIGKQETVLIVGTGLSMIDAVLTLEQQHHTGTIFALSRHGLLPLAHSHELHVEPWHPSDDDMRGLTQLVRKRADHHMRAGGDWRSIVGGLRSHITTIWQQAGIAEKRKFLRHLLPYWNIHRHRVHIEITEMLEKLIAKQQLKILGGRILKVDAEGVEFKDRETQAIRVLPIDWLINCMGPEQQMRAKHQPLIAALLASGRATLDELKLGFAVNDELALIGQDGKVSERVHSLGSPTKGKYWEMTAVPDIRKQVYQLAMKLL